VSALLHTRLGLLIGLLIAATAAAWWLGATRLALGQAGGTAGIAGNALVGLWLARAIVLSPFALRAGAANGARPALAASLALVLAAWPVGLAAWHASTLPASRLLLAEVLLLAGATLLAIVGAALRTLFRSSQGSLAIATMLGIAISVATWTWGGFWMRTLS
jgi:hypothetical protein